MSFHVFHRTWWKHNPNGLEPEPGEKHTIETDVATEREARALCRAWNQENPPGEFSDKAEYEEE